MKYCQTGWIRTVEVHRDTSLKNEPKAKRDILSRCPDSPTVSRSTPSDGNSVCRMVLFVRKVPVHCEKKHVGGHENTTPRSFCSNCSPKNK